MSKVLCEKSDLVAIADSIRSKTGSTDGMKVAEIPQKIEAIETGSNINIQASKNITYTSNGTATITPDAGYDALSSVDVTVDVSGGGGGCAGFKVTFPATAAHWDKVDIGISGLILSDGTVKPIHVYSDISGQTVENVIGISCWGSSNLYVLRMTLSEGVMAQYTTIPGIHLVVAITTAPNTTATHYGGGTNTFWWPLSDVVISAIEMYNTD